MQTGRSFFLCLVLALIASFALTSKPAAPELQTTLLHTTLKTMLPPPLADALSHQPDSLQAQFIDYAAHPVLLARAQLALQVHGQIAPEIFIHHGADPAFQDVLKKYGEGVLLPIQYFRNHDLRPLYWMLHAPAKARAAFDLLYAPPADDAQNAPDADKTANAAQTSREADDDAKADDGEAGEMAAAPVAPPFSLDDPLPAGARWSADVRGRLAIYFMQDEGYAFLSQFEAGDPAKKRIDQDQVERILASIAPAASAAATAQGGAPAAAHSATATAPITDYSLANLSTIGAVRALAIDAHAPASTATAERQDTASAEAGGVETEAEAEAATASHPQQPSVLQMYINRYLALAGPLLHTLPLAENSPRLAMFCLPLRYPQLLDSALSSLAQTFSLPLSAVRFIGWLLLFFIFAWFGRFLITPLLALLSLVSATLQGLRSWLRPQRNWH